MLGLAGGLNLLAAWCRLVDMDTTRAKILSLGVLIGALAVTGCAASASAGQAGAPAATAPAAASTAASRAAATSSPLAVNPGGPNHPAPERVPAGVTAIVVSAHPNASAPRDVPRPVTITSPAKVAQVIALVDGLGPAAAGGVRSCPMMTGKATTVTFLAGVGGKQLAVVSVPVPTCGFATMTADGKAGPALRDPGTVTADVLRIAGVKWTGWNVTPGPQS